jgi:hypothetical protein
MKLPFVVTLTLNEVKRKGLQDSSPSAQNDTLPSVIARSVAEAASEAWQDEAISLEK